MQELTIKIILTLTFILLSCLMQRFNNVHTLIRTVLDLSVQSLASTFTHYPYAVQHHSESVTEIKDKQGRGCMDERQGEREGKKTRRNKEYNKDRTTTRPNVKKINVKFKAGKGTHCVGTVL